MEKVLTIEVNLNLKADQSLVGLIGSIAAIMGGTNNPVQPVPQSEPAPELVPEPQPAPKRTRSKKTDPEPQPAAPAADPEPQPEAVQVSLDEVKQVFFQKLAGHRDEIRKKINELGAPSLSLIESAKLPEMLSFLQSLD